MVSRTPGKNNLLRNSFIISLSLHLALFILLFPAIMSGLEYSSSDIEISDIDVDILDIPPELTGGKKDPSRIEKSEWVEGKNKNAKDTPADEEKINALSGNTEDGEGYLFSIHGDSPPIPLIRFNVNDFYPTEAKQARIRKKTVLVTVQVDEDGALKSARIASGEAGYGFDQAALKVIRLARFRPGYINGRAVKMNHTIAFKFELD